MQKAKDRYHNSSDKEKASEYYLENRNVLKKNAKNKYRNLSEEEKEVKRECQRDRYYMNTDLNEKLKQISKKLL